MARNSQCSQEVIHCIVPELRERDLGSRNDDRLPQILKQETQRGGSVGHGVRSMQHDERVERGIVELNLGGYADPVCAVDRNSISISKDFIGKTVPAISILLLSRSGFH